MVSHDRPPRTYADEDVSLPLIEALREQGFRVLTAREAGMLGRTDEEHLAFARRGSYVVLAFNRRHYRALHLAVQGQHGGIVMIPRSPGVRGREAVRAAMLLDAIAAAPRGVLLNWNEFQMQLHSGHRPPGFDEDQVRLALGLA